MSVANGGDTPLRTISNQDIRDNSWHRGYRGRQANGPKLISSIGGAPEALSAVRMVIEILAGVGGPSAEASFRQAHPARFQVRVIETCRAQVLASLN